MSPTCCEDITRPTPPPEGVDLRIMKASDLPHVRALHVSISSLCTCNAFRLTRVILHAAQPPTCLISNRILRPTSYQPATTLLGRDRPRRYHWLCFRSHGSLTIQPERCIRKGHSRGRACRSGMLRAALRYSPVAAHPSHPWCSACVSTQRDWAIPSARRRSTSRSFMRCCCTAVPPRSPPQSRRQDRGSRSSASRAVQLGGQMFLYAPRDAGSTRPR